MKEYRDYLVQATAAPNAQGEPQIRAFAVTARQLAEEARRIHNTAPVCTAALGRLLCGALMMGSMMKSDGDLLTLRICGDGPMRGLTVTADGNGNVKGYADNPDVVLPPNGSGHLDVGGAVGRGSLTVIRDMGLKEPYSGTVQLLSGEIAEDLAWYYVSSEQIPSAVSLGVLVDTDGTVRQAGGFLIQLMPFADDSLISRIEENVGRLAHVTMLLEAGDAPEQFLEQALAGFPVQVTKSMPVQYHCGCSRERVAGVLMSIGRSDLEEMIAGGKDTELNCQFCSRSYTFSPGELRELLNGSR
ncbi:Hsp33 family molecular chaperone HslO [Lachnoclostridium sp. Marseille-P6806]|uniref:Hsp33 family molecular chaperone HslO n=1 Tax=Lachnoclostridium sp. Marseille-P6806 TaxID=2364793 RepID=UPI001032264F|nr:Hsp33 family molecular chaperone HslO [Lachnoclostridium sp. Marseille-P6806]